MSNQPPPPPPTPIDYARPHADRHKRTILSPRVAIHVWAIAVAFGMATFLGIPKLEEVLKDFKVELPLITKITLLVSRFITNGYGWIPGLILAISLPFGITAMLNIGHPDPGQYRRREVWTGRLLRIVAVLAFLWIALSMFLPYTALINSISGSGGKR